ncbi:MAG: GAF domain-containing protein [Janthinobacterium lividum]
MIPAPCMDQAALGHAASLAATLHRGDTAALVWPQVETALAQLFGHRLFTILVYDAPSATMVRVYSTRPDINPVGGRKRVTDSRWTRHVLQDGAIFRGSTRADIRSVFSDYAVLWGIGCESVLNIPVRSQGVTVGSLNLLDDAGRYDAADLRVATLVAQLCVTTLQNEAKAQRAAPPSDALLEQV